VDERLLQNKSIVKGRAIRYNGRMKVIALFVGLALLAPFSLTSCTPTGPSYHGHRAYSNPYKGPHKSARMSHARKKYVTGH
jgi:hypothetical protein